MHEPSYVYVMASKRNGTLYTGVTTELIQRVWQHREGLIEGFTKKYNVKMLVYYEAHASVDEAIIREKRMKDWQRSWKVRHIETMNPDWEDSASPY